MYCITAVWLTLLWYLATKMSAIFSCTASTCFALFLILLLKQESNLALPILDVVAENLLPSSSPLFIGNPHSPVDIYIRIPSTHENAKLI